MTQESQQPTRAQVEEFARGIRLLHESLETATQRSLVARLFRTVTSSWIVFTAAVSAILAVLGWIIYGVSPLYTAANIGHQQQERRFRMRLIQEHIELGNRFLSVNQLDAAKSEFNAATALDPVNADATFGLLKASVFEPIHAGDYDPEVAQLRLKQILSERPSDSNALQYLGDIYRDIDTATARSWYKSALAHDPSNAAALFGLGILSELQGGRDTALVLYRAAAEASPWNQTYANNLAYQYYLRSEYERADSTYLFLLRLDPRFLLSNLMLVTTQIMLGGTTENNVRILEEQFSDSAVLALPRNRGQWLFHTSDVSTVTLSTSAEKVGLACHMLMLATYLQGSLSDIPRYQARLDKLHLSTEQLDRIQRVVWGDLALLKKAQPTLSDRADSFTRNHLFAAQRRPL